MTMDYNELIARMAAISHRSDLTGQMQNFVNDANEKINRRFGLVLVAPSPSATTNDVLTSFPLLYLYSGLNSLYDYLDNTGTAQYYDAKFNQECNQQNVTSPATVTDRWTVDDIPPAIIPL